MVKTAGRATKRRKRGLRGFDAILYRAQQRGLALSTFVGSHLWHLALDPTRRPPSAAAIRELERRYRVLLDADLANVASGAYPRRLLYKFPLVEYLSVLPEALADLPRILWRRYRNNHGDLPRGVDPDDYPRYYLRTFHWQSDGWLSDRSARLYDATVEFLFGGAADVMRRMAIPPVAEEARASSRPRILDVGSGTGRFLLQLAAALPRARLYGLDLSPHYVRRARQVLGPVTNANLVVDDAEAMPFADAFFDAVTSVFLFHELPPRVRRNIARQVHRVLKPGGRFVVADSAQLCDSAALAEFLDAFQGAYHEPFYRGYLRDDLAAMLAGCGFEVEDSTPWLVSKVVVARKPRDAAAG